MSEQAVMALDAAATMADGDAALVVFAGLLFFGERERFERLLGGDAVKILRGFLALRRSSWAISFDTH